MAAGRTHIPVHDDALCRACRVCVNECPAVVFPELREETDTLRGAVYRRRGGTPPSPRPMPPCQAACPLKQDVAGYVGAVAAGDPDRAIAIIRETNPLPLICGRLCEQPCLKACVRGGHDDAVAIRALKRYAAELQMTYRAPPRRTEADTARLRDASAGQADVAIVGSGPAGLSAAHDLARAGRSVVMLEAAERAGGLLWQAVPTFTLPRDLVAAEVSAIRALGVEIRTGVRVGVDVSLDELLARHRAVLLATGASQGRVPAIRGAAEGVVVDGLELARSVIAGERPTIGRSVAVLGGFPTGIACARIAVRLGAEEVYLVLPGPVEKIPATELQDAEPEGVTVLARHDARAVQVEDGAVIGLSCTHTVEGEEQRKTLAVDAVIATDRAPGLEYLDHAHDFEIQPNGALAVDRQTHSTSQPGLFAAGEVASGPRSSVRAVASGSRATKAILAYLDGEGAKG